MPNIITISLEFCLLIKHPYGEKIHLKFLFQFVHKTESLSFTISPTKFQSFTGWINHLHDFSSSTPLSISYNS